MHPHERANVRTHARTHARAYSGFHLLRREDERKTKGGCRFRSFSFLRLYRDEQPHSCGRRREVEGPGGTRRFASEVGSRRALDSLVKRFRPRGSRRREGKANAEENGPQKSGGAGPTLVSGAFPRNSRTETPWRTRHRNARK